MINHIIIVNDSSTDNISLYTEEPAFMVFQTFSDLGALRNLNEVH